jgi:hypothetical protein
MLLLVSRQLVVLLQLDFVPHSCLYPYTPSPQAGTMSPQLKEEIWLTIFGLLKKPLPARHAETAPPISSILESDLFACLLVNKVSRCSYHEIGS